MIETVDDIKTIANVGTGTMGHAIMLQFALAGYPVHLVGRGEASLEKAMKAIRSDAEDFAEAGLLKDGDTLDAVLARITEWAVDPGAIIDCRTRFTAPVVVADADSGAPDTPTAYLDMAAVVGAIDEEAGTVRLDISVSCGEDTVLGRTQAKVRLA